MPPIHAPTLLFVFARRLVDSLRSYGRFRRGCVGLQSRGERKV